MKLKALKPLPTKRLFAEPAEKDLRTQSAWCVRQLLHRILNAAGKSVPLPLPPADFRKAQGGGEEAGHPAPAKPAWRYLDAEGSCKVTPFERAGKRKSLWMAQFAVRRLFMII